jgi:site-specific DNA recombinase
MTKTARRCAIYARISVTNEESVSLDRQVEAAEQYAAARGWQVVETFRDDGVSATHNKPEDRAAWRALLDSPESFDAVVVWKVDRLARRVLDFLHADEALQARGAGIVAVEQTIDMTTPEGRGFATMLAVFGEMEAAAISARVAAARSHLVRAGRVVGGTVPYGWQSVKNPDGAGYVLAQDPDRVDYVRGAAERVLAGGSIYSTVQWLNEVGAPLPNGSQASRKREGWAYSTVERLLRNPVLSGMTAFNPGNATKQRGTEVLRDVDGLPVVDESVAVLSVPEWRALVKKLDERDSAQSKPRAMRAKTSGLLSGLVYCGEHDGEAVRMHRGTVQGRPGYYCPSCHMAVSNFEDAVVEEFLRQRGGEFRLSLIEEVHEGGAAMLPEIEHRLAELGTQLQATDDDDEADRLTDQIAGLRKLRREARAKAPQVTYRELSGTQTFGEDWAQAETVEARRAVLDDALARLWVRRGRPGRRTDAQLLARLTFDWRSAGQVEAPTDEELASWG